ncbi:unnamed protein product [Blepharisma stoltei]|uniref:Uncharacterized protein n=1 Tax=Blepharisma stoltei TaxID=1481888 RepID=A0AAU9K3A9_9CILI|nr:unnamed protein product [Blepharisma stoltei]
MNVIFKSKDISGNFIKKYNHHPIIIIDNVHLLKDIEDEQKILKLFALGSISIDPLFSVVLSSSEGWTISHILKELDLQRTNQITDIFQEFNETTSYHFHHCMRKEDSEEYVQKAYQFIKGHPLWYDMFFRSVSESSGPINEKTFLKAIKRLLNTANYNFKQMSIYFNNIKNDNHDVLQAMYWLIKSNDPIPLSSLEKYLSDEILSGNIFRVFYDDQLVDFQSNIHRIYASMKFGLFEYPGLETKSFEKFCKQFNLKFKELDELEPTQTSSSSKLEKDSLNYEAKKTTQISPGLTLEKDGLKDEAKKTDL